MTIGKGLVVLISLVLQGGFGIGLHLVAQILDTGVEGRRSECGATDTELGQ